MGDDKERLKKYYERMVETSMLVFACLVLTVMYYFVYGTLHWFVYAPLIISVLLVGGAGILLGYGEVQHRLKLKRETPKVIQAVKMYENGELRMIEAIATTDLSIREFMEVLKRENIEIEFNSSLLGVIK